MTKIVDGFRDYISTKDLDTQQLTEFVEWIRNYAGMEGCYIPTSEEYLSNRFEIDKEINSHKTYL